LSTNAGLRHQLLLRVVTSLLFLATEGWMPTRHVWCLDGTKNGLDGHVPKLEVHVPSLGMYPVRHLFPAGDFVSSHNGWGIQPAISILGNTRRFADDETRGRALFVVFRLNLIGNPIFGVEGIFRGSASEVGLM
jgi:hypothetical protein